MALVGHLNSRVNSHRDLHHGSDVLCHFLFTPRHHSFPFQNVLNALNNKLECFSPKNQVSSHSCHHVGGGNGYSTINFCSTLTE